MAKYTKFIGIRWPETGTHPYTPSVKEIDSVAGYVRRELKKPAAGRSAILRYLAKVGFIVVLARIGRETVEPSALQPRPVTP